MKNFKVGYPPMENYEAVNFSTVESTLPKAAFIPDDLSVSAAF